MSTITERDPITVLFDLRDEDRQVRPFYCVKCGRCVCEVVGNVRAIVPGQAEGVELRETGGRVVVLCRGARFTGANTKIQCDAKYIL